ncbi:MerR family DNA-binding transcriptional regulator [Maridesulfovibrio sp.]|uniref:MerR family transcriptional regulator n=1 Tax=Maridesulfovibrio sp. TaxID=2795000 RepID=UPI002A189F1A|nr:MerR family DNA-binding transcriptional regulator [Maridesulfovibrio sp.]
MKYKERYFIGEMSKLCNISKKALRYYDQINLIPSQRHDYNNYRYYTRESLLAVPVIKYYKQMGFTLEEMKEFIEGNSQHVFKSIQRSFRAKIRALEEEQEKIRRMHVSVKDWSELVREAEMVIDNSISEVSVKYIESEDLLFQDQKFENDLQWSIINLEFTQHVEEVNNEITGPVIINFSSRKDRIEGVDQKIKMLQKTIVPCSDDFSYQFGGEMMLSCYHTGAHEDIHKTYMKMERWAANSSYVLGQDSFERYVTDYWTTNNSAKFVTEVLIKVSRRGDPES